MKKILTDCDGVLLDWETAFHEWMVAKGYSKVVHDTYNLDVAYAIPKTEKRDLVRDFNESSWMVNLAPFRDAPSGVARLFAAGYRFDCITSLSTDPNAKTLRAINLNTCFGSDAFEELVCLDTGADKDDALAKYAGLGLWWIEDKPENCDTGLKFGLKPILIDHPHNRWYDNPAVIRVRTWEELADIVLGE